MPELVKLSRNDDVAIVTIDNPPVNALSPGVPEGIQAAIESAIKDPLVRAIILIGAGQTFIAGADIREFGKIVSGARPRLTLLPFLQVIEDCPKPVIAAIHGQALGGGLETAMAAHYRIMSPTAQVGQPEVKLGLIPGAGGTQRLPRLAGVIKALEMCAAGNPVKAPEALDAGIVDRIIDGEVNDTRKTAPVSGAPPKDSASSFDDWRRESAAYALLRGAIDFAREVADKPFRKTRDRDEKLRDGNAMVFGFARREAQKKGRGMRAPLAAIDAIEGATTMPFDEGCRREAELFDECLFSTQSRSLIHVFFSERAVSKIPGIGKEIKPYEIKRAAVIGAGTMGGGIAMTYANAGIPVIVKETDQAALDRGMATIRKNYANTVAKGRLTQAVMDQRLALIKPQVTYDDFDGADIVVEAVFENMAVKKSVFAELDKIAKPDCVLASNTSSLNIDEIASATGRPEMVIGNHFFSPANVMKLLEVVRGAATKKEVIATSMALGKKLGKVAVLAGNCFGFIGNRMVDPYLREAFFLVEEGASVEEVNRALYEFGMPMGPLAMDDLAGLDVSHAIMLEGTSFQKPGIRRPLIPDLLFQMGRYGQKTGRGWSKYDENRKPSPDPEVAALIEKTAREAGIMRRAITEQEIVDRCIYALINEGARILEEGIALRASDIDIVYVYGYGFPAWRGGPMFYADTVGLKNVLGRIEDLDAQHGGDLWSPAPLLKRLAKEGKTFESFDGEKEVAAL